METEGMFALSEMFNAFCWIEEKNKYRNLLILRIQDTFQEAAVHFWSLWTHFWWFLLPK